ncbi:hypothetical protein KIL84_018733 [Mauremys mutica]|uniref:Uncharacterized protein n=1 Tax=Mauremys mutica TaxID=74926 RepID=A0A9D4BAJ4_9SAUR|nr:hypothetical protein KIL84_018733 [Mauremys mutica]
MNFQFRHHLPIKVSCIAAEIPLINNVFIYYIPMIYFQSIHHHNATNSYMLQTLQAASFLLFLSHLSKSFTFTTYCLADPKHSKIRTSTPPKSQNNKINILK